MGIIRCGSTIWSDSITHHGSVIFLKSVRVLLLRHTGILTESGKSLWGTSRLESIQ